MSAWRPFLLLLPIACNAADPPASEPVQSETPDPLEDNTSDTASPPCLATIVSLDPVHGATHLPLDATVTVRFDRPLQHDTPWTLEVEAVAGEARLSADGTFATWRGIGPLQPSSEHRIVARVCADEARQTFHTQPARFDPEALVGLRWTLEAESLGWVSPSNADALMLLFDLAAVELSVENDPWGQLALTVSLVPGDDHDRGDGDDEDRGPPSLIGPLDLSNNPCIDTGPVDLHLPWRDHDLEVSDVQVHATIDGDDITQIGFSARVDTRLVRDVVGGVDLCAVGGAPACLPCSDGVNACLKVVGAHPGSAPR